jgi:hypothetical protein
MLVSLQIVKKTKLAMCVNTASTYLSVLLFGPHVFIVLECLLCDSRIDFSEGIKGVNLLFELFSSKCTPLGTTRFVSSLSAVKRHSRRYISSMRRLISPERTQFKAFCDHEDLAKRKQQKQRNAGVLRR